MKIAFIGTGIMGASMVRNLIKNGHELSVYNRTYAKAAALAADGARVCGSIPECVSDAQAVITIVGFPADVREVYFSDYGIIANAKAGAFIVDMTTTEPALACEIYQKGRAAGLRPLDAPVTGGDSGAKAGTLTVIVGGDKEDFDAMNDVFSAMGTNIVYAGPAGCGQHVKMCNQIVIAGTIAAICEGFTYAGAKGISAQTMLAAISKGAAGSKQLDGAGVKMSVEDYAPGFFIKHFIKDMTIARNEADGSGVELPVLEQVLEMYKTLQEEGYEDLGTQALIKYYRKERKDI